MLKNSWFSKQKAWLHLNLIVWLCASMFIGLFYVPTVRADEGEGKKRNLSAKNRQVQAIQRVDEQAGWLLSDNRLFFTRDGGLSFVDNTPAEFTASSQSLKA